MTDREKGLFRRLMAGREFILRVFDDTSHKMHKECLERAEKEMKSWDLDVLEYRLKNAEMNRAVMCSCK